MNLIKLFNVAYLKENIKKSKGFILLFLILVPLFTALFTILELNSSGTANIVNQIDISMINIFGMYVIPLVLSFALFGYVFKRNSVDFVNSMPLNRKTIFVTNTIGGILLITFMQLLTAIILAICDALLPNIVIFTSMLIDMFLLMWVSYVFVFIVTNLAMTISGTFLTQIALTMLLLFLIPFCIDGFNEFDTSELYNFIDDNIYFTNTVYEKDTNYTMPYRLINMVLTGSSENIYSTSSILRMLVLGILYFAIGLYLFQKRKMENTEESFASVKMHVFVKALTILPMMILLNLVNPDIEFVIFVIALISVYYFIFDFIVKRKVKLKVSILSLILIFIVTEGICLGANYIKENLPTKEINKEDVEAVSIETYRSYSGGSWYYYREMFTEIEYYFDNQEMIDTIFTSANYVQNMYAIRRNGNRKISSGVEEMVIVEPATQSAEAKSIVNKDYEETANIQIAFKMKSGKKIVSNIEILKTDFDKLVELFEKDEKFVSIVKERFVKEGQTTIEHILCNKETQKIIRDEIKNKLATMPLKDIYQTLRTSENCGVYRYYYENHRLISNTISITMTEKLFNLATEILNQNAVDKIKKAKEEEVYTYFYVDIPETSGKRYTGSIDFSEDVIVNFILENANEKVDNTKEYYILKGNIGNYGSIYFYTNKVEEIDKMMNVGINDGYYFEDVNL